MLITLWLFVTVTTVIFQIIYNAQPTAFIDEIFHIPQSQKYCAGLFNEWDSKITTLPGMYIASMLVLTPLSGIKGSSACTVWALRYLNVFYNAANILLAYYILKKLHSEDGKSTDKTKKEELDRKLQWTSFQIGILPLLYFYSFLYYTDPASTTLVLAAYLACLYEIHTYSAALGFLATLFRQNNIVWVVFMGGTVIANHLEAIHEIEKIKESPELKDKLARFFAKLAAALVRYLLVLDNIRNMIILIWPYLTVVGMFCLFMFFNNGIVVGDRSSHTVVLHIPQFLYLLGFILVFASPILINSDKICRFIQTVQKNLVTYMALSLFCGYVLLTFTHVHPYLLADNRHYVFYLWKWFLGRRFLRFLAIPVYIFSAWSINDSLCLHLRCTIFWKAVFLLCVVVVTVPQKLLELRYFILPYIIFRLHVKPQRSMVVALETLLYIVINIGTILVFLNKTFSWPDLEEPQRIIW